MQVKTRFVGDSLQLCHHCSMLNILLIPALLLLLIGCTTTPDAQPEEHATQQIITDDVMPPVAETEVAEVVQRPFPDDSIYPLLVAEFALRRRDYDTALDNYMTQAPQLRDSGVSAHTSRLAQYLKNDEAAVEATLLWVELEPENLEARLTLANLLAKQGKGAAALPHMAVILRAGGVANFTALATDFNLLNSTAQGELLAAVDQLQREFPDNSQLLICKALMLEALGQQERALETLQVVFETSPQQLQAVVLDAKLRQDLGQVDGIYDRMEAALLEQADNDRLRMQYARLLTRTDIAAARQQFQILLDKAPNDPDLLFSLALIQKEMGDLAAARDKLNKLLNLGQRQNEAHYYLGRIAEQEERYEDALMNYMQVKPGRDFVNATRRLANILMLAQRQQEHGEYFNQLRQGMPPLVAQLYSLEVESLNNHGSYTATIEVLDRALTELPENTSLQYLRSMALEQLGDLESMEADLRSILEREPDNTTVLNALGYTLANKTERYEEAQQLIARALALDPEEPAILDSFGWVRYRLGDYQQALEYLQRAYQGFPDPEVAAHLGEVLWALGEHDAAVNIWHTSLSRNAGSEIILETMRRLDATE